MRQSGFPRRYRWLLLLAALGFIRDVGAATDKLTGFYSARTMSQSMPWIAEEAGLFRKYELDFQLVYISSAPMVTAALLGGDVGGALMGLQVDSGVPIAWGIITPDTQEQALDRAGLKMGNKGREAALAAIELASVLEQI